MRLLRLAWFFALLIPAAGLAAEISVHAARHDDSFEFEASAEIETDVALAWEVLTDYDRLPQFIPGMHESRVVSRQDRKLVVDQRGEASLLFFTFPIEVRLSIEEHPFDRIVSNAIAGNFRELRGAYYLEARGRKVLLRYSGRLTPDFDIPPFIGTLMVRNTVAQRFGAMVDEIRRRQGLRMKPATALPADRH